MTAERLSAGASFRSNIAVPAFPVCVRPVIVADAGKIDPGDVVTLVPQPSGHLQPSLVLRFTLPDQLLVPLRSAGVPESMERHWPRGTGVSGKLAMLVDEVLQLGFGDMDLLALRALGDRPGR